jgi:hypothetical protein
MRWNRKDCGGCGGNIPWRLVWRGIWVGDEMERIFEKHKSGLCGRRSREPSHGNWEARGLAGLGAYVRKSYFLHQASTWSRECFLLSHPISRIEPGIQELSLTPRIPRRARSLHREESILAVFRILFGYHKSHSCALPPCPPWPPISRARW